MAGASDPLLLTKQAQKLIKGAEGVAGRLLITQSKVKWLPHDQGSTNPATIEISSITKQQQAPGKPLLRILSAGDPLGLSFASEEDKNEVLDLLKQLKPSSAAAGRQGPTGGGPIPDVPTAAQRQQLFAADKDLEVLYRQLVVSGILAEADFWRTRQGALAQLAGSAGGPRQRRGVSSVMHDVERLHDGQTERVNINLTPQDIQRIFTERPEVHRAYLANVPHALQEQEFWQRYFKLEYRKAAKRRRLAAVGRLDAGDDELEDDDDLFAPFRRQLAEQDSQRAKLKMRMVDPTVNLVAGDADEWAGPVAAGEGGGSEATDAARGAAGRGGRRRDDIARDLNRHAAVVLEGAVEGLQDVEAGEGGTAGIAARVAAAVQARQKQQSLAAAAAGAEAEPAISEETQREWQQRAAAALEDLTLDEQEEVVPLDIQDPRAYFGSTAGDGATAPKAAAMSGGQGWRSAIQQAADAAARVNPVALRCPPCDPVLAGAVLLEIGRDEDEALVREFGAVAAAALGTHPKDALGSVMVEFFRSEALKTNELLRHFWGCMPLTSDPRRRKAEGLATHLTTHRKQLEAHMRTNPGTVSQVYVTQMLRPLEQALDAALDRFEEELQLKRTT